jgi:hypothetical protein
VAGTVDVVGEEEGRPVVVGEEEARPVIVGEEERLGFWPGGSSKARGRERPGGNGFTLSVRYAWRTPQRCATVKLCAAHHTEVRHACPRILQKNRDSHLDNSLHIA